MENSEKVDAGNLSDSEACIYVIHYSVFNNFSYVCVVLSYLICLLY